MLQYQSISNELLMSSEESRFHQCIRIGNALIGVASLLVAACILVTFIFDQNFSLTTQIIAHVGTIVFAGILKIGYVVRCIGAHGLGHSAY